MAAPPHPMLRSASSIGSGEVPVVILVGTTFQDETPQSSSEAYVPPLAFQSFHGKPLIEHWWDTLVASGLNMTTHIFVATNATHYKSFEFWALGKGIPIKHIINSGSSIGDSRVGLRTVIQALRASNKTAARVAAEAWGFPHDFLVIGVDSVPPHSGAGFKSVVEQLVTAPTSAMLLQGPATPADSPAARAGSGPVVRSFFVADASSGDVVVKDVQSSTAASAASPAAASIEGAQAAFSPIVFLLKGADAHTLTATPAVYNEIAAECAAAEGAAATATASATAGGGAAASAATSSAAAAASVTVPIEAGLSYIARKSTLSGIVLDHAFQIGAAQGHPHALPDALAHAAASSSAASGGGGAASSAGGVVLASPSRAFGHAPIRTRAYARVGVLGNPSDGFGGKTLSVTIDNFFAEVLLHPASDSSITLQPHPIYDPTTFTNIRQLSTISGREGYSGGLRLLQAALHRFFRHCRMADVDLPDKGFTVRYHTSVPRQVGLAGSSAIVTAFMRAVLAFYGFGDEAKAASIGLSRDQLPAFVLAVENEELGITAGLQDRVVQSYQGCVHMDFDAETVKAKGFGTYTKLPVSALPPLFLAYAADPSDSGRIHAPVKQRWLAGDREVIDGMTHIASIADAGRALCTAKPYGAAGTVAAKEAIVKEWAALFFNNFESRRKLFGDAALGRDNIRMIEIARETGASGKFPGSGGAILGVVDVAGIEAAGKLPATAPKTDDALPAAEQQRIAQERVAAALSVLREAYLAEGFVFTPLQPHETA